MNSTIGFIGGGNMATAIISGLVVAKLSDTVIWVSDPNPEKLQQSAIWPHVQVSADNLAVATHADVVILAVKPQLMPTVCQQLSQLTWTDNTCIVSIAAGVTIASLRQWLQSEQVPLVRCMPNTPALIQHGVSALYAESQVTALQRAVIESIFKSTGVVRWLDSEQKMHTVTALSGSGPAYFFWFLEQLKITAQFSHEQGWLQSLEQHFSHYLAQSTLHASDFFAAMPGYVQSFLLFTTALIEAGSQFDLDKPLVEFLILHTAMGALQLAIPAADNLSQLRKNVTSKGGTTAAALQVLEHSPLAKVLQANPILSEKDFYQVQITCQQALRAARDRSIELALS